jgi:hypothetical protein
MSPDDNSQFLGGWCRPIAVRDESSFNTDTMSFGTHGDLKTWRHLSLLMLKTISGNRQSIMGEDKLKKLLIAITAIAAMTASAQAATLDFDFSYSNTYGSTAGSDPGLITGEIILPSSCTSTCAALEVIITGLPAGFSIGETLPFDTTIAGDDTMNAFKVSSKGVLQSYNYYSLFSPAGEAIYLSGGLGEVGDEATGGTAGAISFQAVPSTPLPAALPLFAGGLAMVGWLARRRKRNASQGIAAA